MMPNIMATASKGWTKARRSEERVTMDMLMLVSVWTMEYGRLVEIAVVDIMISKLLFLSCIVTVVVVCYRNWHQNYSSLHGHCTTLSLTRKHSLYSVMNIYMILRPPFRHGFKLKKTMAHVRKRGNSILWANDSHPRRRARSRREPFATHEDSL